MLLPRLGWGSFADSFVVTMLVFDLVGLDPARETRAPRWRRRRGMGLALAMPMLRALPVLRFDLVPTVIAIGALAIIHRRPTWFGALAGLGAMVKAWPIALLFGEWDKRRLLLACACAAATIGLVFAISAIAFGATSSTSCRNRTAADCRSKRSPACRGTCPVRDRPGTADRRCATAPGRSRAAAPTRSPACSSGSRSPPLSRREPGGGRGRAASVAVARTSPTPT